MNFSTMLVLWLQIGFVLLLALAACLAAKRFPSLRLAITRVSLVAAFGLFVCLPWLGSRESPVVAVNWAGPASMAATPSPKPATPLNDDSQTASPTSSAGNVSVPDPLAAATGSSNSIDPLAAAAGIWALGVCFLTIHLGLGYFALARIRRSARRVSDSAAQEMLAALAKRANLKAPWLMESEQVGVPFVAGAMRPTIYVPAGWTQSVEPETLRAVLSHELAHISNGDIRWTLFHRAISTLLWPQPLLWLLKRPMTAASEEICDQHVLSTGIPEHRYADCLLNLREGLGRRPAPSLGIGAFSSKSQLGKRIEALMDSRRSRIVKLSPKVTFLLRVCAVGIAVGATLIFASPSRPGAQSQDPFANWVMKPYDATIRMLDESGKPYAGKAQAFMSVQGQNRGQEIVELKVKDGKILLDASLAKPGAQGTLIVKAPGHGLQFEFLWPVEKALTEIRLGPSTSLKGRFLLPDGKPASGLNVAVGMLIRPGKERSVFAVISKEFAMQTKTDAQGRYMFEGLPAGVSAQIVIEDTRFAMLTFEQRGDTSKGIVDDIRLQPGASFSGRVVRNGKPVPGVIVAAQENNSGGPGIRGDWAETVTDAQGRYTLHGLGPVLYNIALDLEGLPIGDEVAAPAHEGVTGKPGQTIGNLDFDLKPGGVIEGVVYSRDGKPMPNTMVGCYGPTHPNSSAWVQSVTTDAKGRYRFRVAPGEQRVYWMGGEDRSDQKVTVLEGGTLTLDLHLDQSAGGDSERRDFAPSAEPLKKPAKAKVASYGSGTPFYGPVKLKSGLTARVAYIQDDSSGAHNIWRPDGSAGLSADVERSLDMTGFASRREGSRSVFVRLDIEGANRGDYFCLAEVPHHSDWTVWQTYGDSKDDGSMDMASFRAPADLTQTDIRFGISAGPFKPYATWKAGERSSLPITIEAPSGNWGVSGGPNPTVSVTLEVPASLQNAFMKFQVYDREGRELHPLTLSPESDVDKETGKHTRTCVLTGAEPSEVSLVKVGIRGYEWITFKGIRLYPNR